jgi:hypothetical protein
MHVTGLFAADAGARGGCQSVYLEPHLQVKVWHELWNPGLEVCTVIFNAIMRFKRCVRHLFAFKIMRFFLFLFLRKQRRRRLHSEQSCSHPQPLSFMKRILVGQHMLMNGIIRLKITRLATACWSILLFSGQCQ